MYCYMLCNAMYYLLCALIHCAVLGCSFLDLDRVQRLHALSGALFTHGHTLLTRSAISNSLLPPQKMTHMYAVDSMHTASVHAHSVLSTMVSAEHNKSGQVINGAQLGSQTTHRHKVVPQQHA